MTSATSSPRLTIWPQSSAHRSALITTLTALHYDPHRLPSYGLSRWAPGGGSCSGTGGIDSMHGASSGHTRSTGKGAWSTMKRVALAQAVRTETRTVTVAGHNQEVDALDDCADNFALHSSPKMKKLGVLPSEPRCRGF